MLCTICCGNTILKKLGKIDQICFCLFSWKNTTQFQYIIPGYSLNTRKFKVFQFCFFNNSLCLIFRILQNDRNKCRISKSFSSGDYKLCVSYVSVNFLIISCMAFKPATKPECNTKVHSFRFCFVSLSCLCVHFF